MKRYKFYLEFPDAKSKRKSGKENKGHSGTVIAVYLDQTGNPISYMSDGVGMVEAAGAVQDIPNSPVCFSANPSIEYLQTQCKRISAAFARKVHPKLFEALEMYEQESKNKSQKISVKWIGLSGQQAEIGDFQVSHADVDELDGIYGYELSIDVWEEIDEPAQHSFKDVEKAMKKTEYGKILFK